MPSFKAPPFLVFASVVLIATGCGRPSAPTSPTTSSTQVGSAPVITSVSPAELIASPVAQAITVTGTNFRSGLSFAMGLKDSAPSVIDGTSITNVTGTSFQASVTIAVAGTYEFHVTNPGPVTSNAFTLAVQAPLPAMTV